MILIIGYGNSLRQDDGGGLRLAEQIEQTCKALKLPAKRISMHQLVPELALDIAGEDVDSVIFADTRIVPPFEVTAQVEIEPLTTEIFSPTIGHHLLPEVLLIYAYRLYGRQPSAWLATVPGVQFDHGEELSQITKRALNTATNVIHTLLITQLMAATVFP